MDDKEMKALILERGELVDSIKEKVIQIDQIEKKLKAVVFPAKTEIVSGKYVMAVAMVRSSTVDDALLEAKIIGLGLKPESFKILQWDSKNETLKALTTDEVKRVGSVSQRITFK